MKIAKFLGTIGVVAISIAGSVVHAEINEHSARFGHGLAADHPQGKAATFFADKVAELSDGKISISVIPNGSLGGDQQMLAALQGGVQQFYAGSALELVSEVPELGFQDIPFQFKSESDAHTFFDGPAMQIINDKLAKRNVVVLGWWENGFRQITNSRHPVKTIEELKGLKFRTQPNPMTLAAFNALGANAAPLPWSELFVALETGAFDGQENPIVLMYTQRFYEVQKYMTLSNHVYSPLLFAVSKKFFDSLNAEEQELLMNAAKEATAHQRQQAATQVETALEGMKEEGVEVIELAEGEVDKIRELIAPVIEENISSYDPAFVEVRQAELDKLK